jgi:signal transduction histidine kinase
LHDSLGQNLLLIKNRAVMGLKDNATPEKMRAQLQEISEASAGSVEEIRAIARALRPYQLDRLGLTKTLEDVAESVTTAGGLCIESQVDNIDGVFSPDAEIGLYRIVQECLNNAVKHSGAAAVVVRLRREHGLIALTILDDGRGFDSSNLDGAISSTGSFGLRNIVERARTMAGSVRCKSGSGDGTRFDVEIPVKPG